MARFSSRCHGHGVAGAPSVVNSAQARSALLQGQAHRDRGRFPFTDAADAGSSVSLTDGSCTRFSSPNSGKPARARGVLVCRGHHDTRRRGRASRRLRKVGLANGSLLSALYKGPTTNRRLASTASVRTPYFAPDGLDRPGKRSSAQRWAGPYSHGGVQVGGRGGCPGAKPLASRHSERHKASLPADPRTHHRDETRARIGHRCSPTAGPDRTRPDTHHGR